MAKLSITEAARQAGICRQYLYTKYIKPGALTVHKDEQDKPYIDSAELLRVFDGRLPGPKQSVTVDASQQAVSRRSATVVNDSHTVELQAEVKALREQLTAAQEREKSTQARERWLEQTVDKLTDTIKLLEHRPADQPAQAPRRGFFARLFGGGQ